uniref:EGF-like domain-containing protein n=1 Tax=Globodera pallida TaxID=36090 RepID=A0A183CJP4_GLOPA
METQRRKGCGGMEREDGECTVEFEAISCRCVHNFHGDRCQLSFDPHVFGFSRVNNGVEGGASSVIAVFLILMIVVFIWCLALHWREFSRSISSSVRTLLNNRRASSVQSHVTITTSPKSNNGHQFFDDPLHLHQPLELGVHPTAPRSTTVQPSVLWSRRDENNGGLQR